MESREPCPPPARTTKNARRDRRRVFRYYKQPSSSVAVTSLHVQLLLRSGRRSCFLSFETCLLHLLGRVRENFPVAQFSLPSGIML